MMKTRKNYLGHIKMRKLHPNEICSKNQKRMGVVMVFSLVTFMLNLQSYFISTSYNHIITTLSNPKFIKFSQLKFNFS